MGNTVIVVEHDEEMIRAADHVIDLGPGAGIHGGEIVAEGTVEDICNSKRSITAEYLKGEKLIELKEKERKDSNNSILISGATTNNLNGVNVDIPLNKIVAVTGVSGSGKSSLINHTLIPGINSKLNNSKLPEKTKFSKLIGEENIDKLISIIRTHKEEVTPPTNNASSGAIKGLPPDDPPVKKRKKKYMSGGRGVRKQWMT